MDKKLRYLFLVTGILVLVVLLKNYQVKLIPQKSLYGEKLGKVKPEDVQKFTISREGSELVFTSDGESWRIKDKNADKDKINRVLQGLIPTKDPELVAQAESSLADFGLNASGSANISLDGGPVLLLGKIAQPQGIYARFADETRVYLLDGLAEYDLSVKEADWLDRTIVELHKDRTGSLRISYRGKDWRFVNEGGSWNIVSSGEKSDQEKINGILDSLAPLTALNISQEEEPDPAKYPLQDIISLEFDQEGAVEKLDIYPGEYDAFIKRMSDGQSFITGKNLPDKIIEAVEDFVN